MSGVVATLTSAGEQAMALAKSLTLDADDWHHLARAFHRAEALAEQALVVAIAQVRPELRPALVSQLDDERRHVGVFAEWVDGAPLPPVQASDKQRPEVVWLTLLLANEVAGYCQFRLLEGVCGASERGRAVAAVASDEVAHVARLVTWLQEPRYARARAQLVRVMDSFIAGLEARMSQFLPREAHLLVRGGMADLIGQTLGALLALRPPGS